MSRRLFFYYSATLVDGELFSPEGGADDDKKYLLATAATDASFWRSCVWVMALIRSGRGGGKTKRDICEH